MENQIPFGFRTKDDWPKWLRNADGIPEKTRFEPDVAPASSGEEVSDSPSQDKPPNPFQCQVCRPDADNMPDEWVNECGKL
eukprot:8580312-Karenia_brevis.AAC.1